jgi:hypothetical protein
MFLLRGMMGHRRKCCKSSVAKLHEKNMDEVNEPAHTHKSCCGDRKPQTTCMVQTCSSKISGPRGQSSNTSSGETHKHQDSSDKHNHCGQGNQHKYERKQSGGAHKYQDSSHKHSCRQGNQYNDMEYLKIPSCNHGNHDVGSEIHHDGEINCSNTNKRNSDGIVDAGAHEINQCHHDNHKTISCHGSSSQSSVVAHSTADKQCQEKSCLNHKNDPPTTDEEMGNVAILLSVSSSKYCSFRMQEYAAECGAKQLSTINIFGDDHHGGCRNMKRPNLNKRQGGRCCQSFRKECCAKNSHFGSNFRGGMSKIVIE